MNILWRELLAPKGDHLQSLPSINSTRTQRSAQDYELQKESEFWVKHHHSLGNYKVVFPVIMVIVFPILIFIVDIMPLIILPLILQNEVEVDDDGDLGEGPNGGFFFIVYVIAGIHLLIDIVIFTKIVLWIRRLQSHTVADSFYIGHELQYMAYCFFFFLFGGELSKSLLILMDDGL